MVRRAEWRRAKEDPKTKLGLVWSAFRGFSHLTLCLCLILASGAALLTFRATPLVLPIFVLLSLALLYASPPRGRSESVATLPLPDETYLVRVTTLSKGIVMGYDDAVASFVDGWLHVEGVRTSFSLRAADGHSKYATYSPTLRVAFDDGGSVRIERVPPHEGTTEARSSAAAFYASSKRWFDTPSPKGGESIFPPLEAQPTVVVRTAVRTALLLGTLFLAEYTLYNDPSSGIMPFRVHPLSSLAYLYLFGPPSAVLYWTVRTFSEILRRNRETPTIAPAPLGRHRTELRPFANKRQEAPPVRGDARSENPRTGIRDDGRER